MEQRHQRGGLVQRIKGKSFALGSAVAITLGSGCASFLENIPDMSEWGDGPSDSGQTSTDHYITSLAYGGLAANATTPQAAFSAGVLSDYERMQAQAAMNSEVANKNNPRQNVQSSSQLELDIPKPIGLTKYSYAYVYGPSDIWDVTKLQQVGNTFDLDRVPQVCFSTDGDCWPTSSLKNGKVNAPLDISIINKKDEVVYKHSCDFEPGPGACTFTIDSRTLTNLDLEGPYRVSISGSVYSADIKKWVKAHDNFDIRFTRSQKR